MTHTFVKSIEHLYILLFATSDNLHGHRHRYIWINQTYPRPCKYGETIQQVNAQSHVLNLSKHTYINAESTKCGYHTENIRVVNTINITCIKKTKSGMNAKEPTIHNSSNTEDNSKHLSPYGLQQ